MILLKSVYILFLYQLSYTITVTTHNTKQLAFYALVDFDWLTLLIFLRPKCIGCNSLNSILILWNLVEQFYLKWIHCISIMTPINKSWTRGINKSCYKASSKYFWRYRCDRKKSLQRDVDVFSGNMKTSEDCPSFSPSQLSPQTKKLWEWLAE